MIEVALKALLEDHADLAPLIGDRVYPNRLPQAPVYPCIRYIVASGGKDAALDPNNPTTLALRRFQIDCFADDYDVVLQVKKFVIRALHGFQGEVGSPPIRIHGAFLINEIDAPEDELERAGVNNVARKSLEFNVHFKEVL